MYNLTYFSPLVYMKLQLNSSFEGLALIGYGHLSLVGRNRHRWPRPILELALKLSTHCHRIIFDSVELERFL